MLQWNWIVIGYALGILDYVGMDLDYYKNGIGVKMEPWFGNLDTCRILEHNTSSID